MSTDRGVLERRRRLRRAAQDQRRPLGRLRRPVSRRPWRAKAAATSSASWASRPEAISDARRRRRRKPVARDAQQQRAQQVGERRVGAVGAGPSRTQVEARDARPPRRWPRRSRAVARDRLAARGRRRRPGAQPSLAAAIASTPEPQPRSMTTRRRRGSRLLEQQLQAQPRRVRARRCRTPGRVDDEVHQVGRAPARATAAARAASPPISTGWWNVAPAVGPVVGDLGGRRPRRARRRPRASQVGQRRQLARRAVDGVLDDAAVEVDLLDPAGREREQLGERRARRPRAARGPPGGSLGPCEQRGAACRHRLVARLAGSRR